MDAVIDLVEPNPLPVVAPRASRTARATTAATLAAAWRARCQRSPQRTALVFEGTRFSYQRLHLAACQVARRLGVEGLAPGDRVILMMDNGPDFVSAFFGCQLIGVVPIPVSPSSSVQRMRYLLADSEAELVLMDATLPRSVRSLHKAQAYGPRVLMMEPELEACEPPELSLDPDDCAFIQYTSGSSADPKGVLISHRAAQASIAGFARALGLRRDDVFASMLPMCHDTGLVWFGLGPLLSGHMLVLHRAAPVYVHEWLADIGKHRATITCAPDSLLQLANRAVEVPARFDLTSLRALVCVAEPVQHETIETFGSRFGVLHAIKPAYGMAELALCATLTHSHEPARIDAQGHVACGRPMRGVEVCIATESGVLTREPGVHGEIRVRSPAAMRGYWMRSSADAFDAHGYLRTGDIGYLDAQGCLYVLGRMSDMLVCGARKLSPHDLEAAAAEMPPIGRAAVVQSARAEARIIAVLEVGRKVLQDESELQRLSCSYRNAARQRSGIAPSDCWFVLDGCLPCTDDGKIRHAALRSGIDHGRFIPAWADTGGVRAWAM